MSAELTGDDQGREGGPDRFSGVRRRADRTQVRYIGALVLALGLVAAACADGGESARPPQAATSAPPPPRVDRACATRQSEPASEAVRGEIVVMSRADPRVPGNLEEDHRHFVLTPCGDVRLETATVVNAHDAVEGATRSLVNFDQIASRATVISGVAPAPPDAAPLTYEQLGRAQAAYVLAGVAAEDPRVEDVVHDGREAWRVVTPARVSSTEPEGSGDRLEIVVDRETRLALLVRETKDGDLVREQRFLSLQEEAQIPPSLFSPSFPDGAEVERLDRGFRRVELGEVAGAVGYQPLAPTWLPDGFELLHVAVGTEPAANGVRVSNPPARDVTILEYGNAYNSLVITTRRATNGDASWSDPLATGPGFDDEHETARIEGGVIDGVAAEVLVVPRTVPHLWAAADGLVITIAGGLSEQQLLRVAGSLSRAEG
ncbi:MAG TPA: hypothetical protein VG455_10155 [Acidimicrobiales bacterium]|nr:hypothetical protein [Acidimicrobiales bacterium]